jgi:hypothetical protein
VKAWSLFSSMLELLDGVSAPPACCGRMMGDMSGGEVALPAGGVLLRSRLLRFDDDMKVCKISGRDRTNVMPSG